MCFRGRFQGVRNCSFSWTATLELTPPPYLGGPESGSFCIWQHQWVGLFGFTDFFTGKPLYLIGKSMVSSFRRRFSLQSIET